MACDNMQYFHPTEPTLWGPFLPHRAGSVRSISAPQSWLCRVNFCPTEPALWGQFLPNRAGSVGSISAHQSQLCGVNLCPTEPYILFGIFRINKLKNLTISRNGSMCCLKEYVYRELGGIEVVTKELHYKKRYIEVHM